MNLRKTAAVVGFSVLGGAVVLGAGACSSPPPANPDVEPQACEELEDHYDEELAEECRDYAVYYTLSIPESTWIFGSWS